VKSFTDLPSFTVGFLLFEACFFDEFDEGLRGAVTNRRFVGVHFDEGIVDAESDEGGDDVLYSVDADGAGGKGGGAFDSFDTVNVYVDEGFVGEVDTSEFKAVAFWGRVNGEGDFFASVEGGAFEAGGVGERVFFLSRHGWFIRVKILESSSNRE